MIKIKLAVIIISTFLWIGFVCAISFMEAWLKFRARGVTVPIGLSIGKLIFGVLNKMEWLFATIIFIGLLIGENQIKTWHVAPLGIAAALLSVQTVWLLPALDKMADAYIKRGNLQVSSLHRYFVVAEVIKVIALIFFGIGYLKY